jgi:AraC-like DNA-binding protein
MIKTTAINLVKSEPMMVTWDLGRRCNYDCSYCEASRHDLVSPHHTLDEFTKTFEFIKSWTELYNTQRQITSHTNINFTGGEPTVNPNFWNLVKHINEDIEINKITFKEIWKIDNTTQPTINQKDIALYHKIKPIISDYIHKIEDTAYNTTVFRNKELTIEEFSSEVRIPVSHLKYLFTFHCIESFSDYKKIIRITDAIKLLETNYIKTNTIESLSQEVGFKSYTTFFTAFKAVTGKSPQEFLR